MVRRYRLRPQWGITILIVLSFGACTALAAHRAATTDRGLVIDGIITLGPGGASTFFAVLAVVSAAMTVLGLAANLRLALATLEVVVDADSIRIPGSLFRPGARTLRFAEVGRVQVQEVGGQAFVFLATATRKASVARLTIGPAAFDELVRLIEERVAAARAA